MAAPTVAQIRAGLAANLGAIGERQISAYRLANPTVPSIQVTGPIDEIEYHQAMQNGHDLFPFAVMAFVGIASDIGAQKRLDEFISATGAASVKAAIEADKTLGGLACRAIVESCSGYREYALPNQPGPVLGAEWRVRVEADGA